MGELVATSRAGVLLYQETWGSYGGVCVAKECGLAGGTGGWGGLQSGGEQSYARRG